MAYLALSYTWGIPGEAFPEEWDDELYIYPIFVNGRRFHVRLNLYSALCELARSSLLIHGRRPIWIDALCIDQSNIEEKNAQVYRMGDIYSHACETIVWLGPDDGTTAAAYWTMRSILRNSYKQNNFTPGQNPTRFIPSFGRTWDAMIQDQELESKLQQILRPIQALRRRSWFSRVWVWQEVCLASDTTFWCGPHRVGLYDCERICGTTSTDACFVGLDCEKDDPGYQAILKWIETLEVELAVFRNLEVLGDPRVRRESHLTSVLRSLRHTQASDPRDKIFAIRGLCPAHERVQVDYTMPLNDVFLSAVSRHIDNHDNVSFLQDCRLATCLEIGSNRLPSWVPDWSDCSFPRRTDRELDEVSFYYDHRIRRKGHTPPPHISPDGRVLRVRGRMLDKIKFIALVHNASTDYGHDGTLARLSGFFTTVSEHSATILPANGALWLHDWARKHLRGGCHLQPARCLSRRRIRLKRRVTLKASWTYRCNGAAHQFDKLLYWRTEQTVLDEYEGLMNGQGKTSVDTFLANHLAGKTFASSTSDLFLLVPVEARVGDEILIIMGEFYPYIVRRADKGYMVVGECNLGRFTESAASMDDLVGFIERRGGWEDINLV